MTPPQASEAAVGGGWIDEDLARHWIDRYAAGIDPEPQMDRILDCVVPEDLPDLLDWVAGLLRQRDSNPIHGLGRGIADSLQGRAITLRAVAAKAKAPTP